MATNDHMECKWRRCLLSLTAQACSRGDSASSLSSPHQPPTHKHVAVRLEALTSLPAPLLNLIFVKNPVIRFWLLVLPLVAEAGSGTPGPYAPAAGQPGSDAIASSDARFKGWATGVVSLQRGRTDLADVGAPLASYGLASSAVGPSDLNDPLHQPEIGTSGPFPVVSLGDGGSITLHFAIPIADGPGPDFAVFENSFSPTFLELAFVEVSSDGAQFVRFPAVSCTATTTQVTLATAGGLAAANLKNLAGKYQGGYGTPFDLAELKGATIVNLGAITHVRLVDVVGSVNPAVGTRDAQNNLINDPYPTDYETGGFDLDAVGILNQAAVGYAAWKTAIEWTTGDSAPAADPDGDGLPNSTEYAFSTDPMQPNLPPAISLSLAGEEWIATFPTCRTGAIDLLCGVETSDDLTVWNYRAGLEPLTLGSVRSAPQRYCRLRFHLAVEP
jgi:hypothetical protein